jgi:adenylate cyclase
MNSKSTKKRSTAELIEKILDQRLANQPTKVHLVAFCNALADSGIKVTSATLGIPHPEDVASLFHLGWVREKGLSERYSPEGTQKHPPVAAAKESGGMLRVSMKGKKKEPPFSRCAWLSEKGFTDYMLFVLPLNGGEGYIELCTDEEGGFSKADPRFLEKVMSPFAERINRVQAEARVKEVGQGGGGAILTKLITERGGPGTITTLRGVLWIADLRGYGRLLQEESLKQAGRTLNSFVQTIAGVAEDGDGELVSVSGDAALVFFPFDPELPRMTCWSALTAVEAATSDMGGINSARKKKSQRPLSFRSILHAGEVAVAEVGKEGHSRQVVMGPVTNESFVLVELAADLEKDLVITEAFAQIAERDDINSLGKKALPGGNQVSLYTI